jgi:CheY-like chemotaxis protein
LYFGIAMLEYKDPNQAETDVGRDFYCGFERVSGRMATANARPLLLLVEDYAETRQMYAEFLGDTFDVLQAADGQEALALLATSVPALIITDFTLPGIDGFELIRQIRRNASMRAVPVICLSGHGGRAHEQRAHEAGCTCVLEKPCLPETLATTARELVREHLQPGFKRP